MATCRRMTVAGDAGGDAAGLRAEGAELAGLGVESDEPEPGRGLRAAADGGASVVVEDVQMADER